MLEMLRRLAIATFTLTSTCLLVPLQLHEVEHSQHVLSDMCFRAPRRFEMKRMHVDSGLGIA